MKILKTLLIGIIIGMFALSAHADLTSETYKTIFLCDASTTEFDFDFKVFDEDDIEVILVLESTLAETTLTLGSGAGKYTVADLSDTGGTVTTGSTYAATYTLVVRRNQALKQEIDYVPHGPFSTTVLEQGLDEIVMMIQDNKEELSRTLLRSGTETTTITFPAASASKVIAWNSGATGLENITNPAVAAAVSAAAALVSETAAGTAETNAETAETNAETAETNAETAETNAETAQTAAEAALAALEWGEPLAIGQTTPNLGSFTILTGDTLTDGTLSITDGQITFPASQSASADANTLDDYEEGTWTVTITPGSSGTVTLKSTNDTGYYIKIGSLVYVQGYVEVDSVDTPTGTGRVNLPFTVGSSTETSDYTCGSITMANVDFIGTWENPFTYVGLAYFYLRGTTDAGAITNESANIFSANDGFTFSMTYVAAN